MWTGLIVLIWICTLGVSFAIGVRITRKHGKLELERIVNDARINDDLNPQESTKIKEWRMILAGVAFCIDCGHVSGLKYEDKDKKPMGITLKKVGQTKEGSSIHRCITCFRIHEAEENRRRFEYAKKKEKEASQPSVPA